MSAIITLLTAVAEERDSIGTEPGFDVAHTLSYPAAVTSGLSVRVPGTLATWQGQQAGDQ